MADNLLQNGVPRFVASIPNDPNGENTVAVIADGGSGPWVLRFWAMLGTLRTYVGAVRFFADRHARLVAVVSVPGATSFECEGMAANVATTESLRVTFEGIEARGGPWGVSAIPGLSVAGARSYRVASGNAGGVVTITGEVYGWAAETTLAGGTVSVSALPGLGFGPTVVPQNGSVRGDAMGLLAPESTWTFANVNAWMIEYVPPGLDFDG
jgi:hypothetical protein